MSWSYWHRLTGTRLEGRLLFVETAPTLAGVQNLNFWGKSCIFNISVIEETVNCFSADFEVQCTCKNIKPIKYRPDAKLNYSYDRIHCKKYKSGLSKTN